MSTRSYDDPCGLARALDAVGERWALLAVRELLLGPKRFTDLRTGLPGASPNVLAQRLRELEAAGVVRRRRLGPPAGSHAYELTERGAALEPVLVELSRWGSRGTPPRQGLVLGTDALMLAFKTTFAPALARGVRASVALVLGDETFALTVSRGRLSLTRGEPQTPDARLATDAETLRALVFRRRSLADALRAGAATVSGSRATVVRILGLFPPPSPASDSATPHLAGRAPAAAR